MPIVRKSTLVLAAVTSSLASVFVFAQSSSPTPKSNTEEKWNEYVYDNDGFAVTLPYTPSPHKDAYTRDGTAYPLSMDGLSVIVRAANFPQGCVEAFSRYADVVRKSAKEIREGTLDKCQSDFCVDVASVQEMEVAGHPAIEHVQEVKSTNRMSYERWLCVNKRLFILSAEWPVGKPKPAEVIRIVSSFRLLPEPMIAAAESDQRIRPGTYERRQWPVFFAQPIERSGTICVEVAENRSVRYYLSLAPQTQVKLLVDGELVRASSEPVSAISGSGFSAGKHLVEIQADTPVDMARLALMGSSAGGDDARAARLCGAAEAPPLRPTAAIDGRSSIGGNVKPYPIFSPEPQYSQEALEMKIEGTVMLAIVVDTDGKAKKVRVVRGLGQGLDEKAIEAVGKWRFKPGQKDGELVAVQAYVQVNFRLSKNVR